MSVSTGSYGRCLPKVKFQLWKIANLGQKLTAFAAIFDGATEFHAALIFLLTTGFDSAVAFFVGHGHFESPKASTGVSG
ncbi:HMA domain-containing protein [Pseudomonas jessenii]